MGADPDGEADGADDAPERQNRAPIDQTSDGRTAFAAPAAARFFPLRPRRSFAARAATCVARLFRRTADPVLRADAKIQAFGGAAALTAVSPGHVPSPRASWRVPMTVDRAL